MISKQLALDVINYATSTGADFAEIFYEDSTSKVITVENDKVDSVNSSNINGVGLRLLKGTKSVYGSTSDLSRKSLIALADTLAKYFEGERVLEKITGFTKVPVKRIHKKYTSVFSVPTQDVIDYLKKATSIVKDYSAEVRKSNATMIMKESKIVIFNSDGKTYSDHKEYGRLALQSIAGNEKGIQAKFDGPGAQGGWEFFTNQLNLEELAKKHAEKLILMLHARECPSGKFPVVIGNGWGGVIFHEACGHQLEATSVAKGMSVFSGMKGEKIANECVTAYDDGSIPNEWGSNNLDDEGLKPRKNELIKDGILTGYLVDSFNGRRMNEPGNGCSRRQNYKFEPTSRMSNTYIANGKSTKEEIIAATKLGIYAVSFGGGSVDPSTGDFNFGCDEAYIIKDGKIGEPVRGATLVGNARDILKHIDMVGNDLAFGQGNCGSASGSVPVNVGQPTIRVDEIVVGGRGGSIDEF